MFPSRLLNPLLDLLGWALLAWLFCALVCYWLVSCVVSALLGRDWHREEMELWD